MQSNSSNNKLILATAGSGKTTTLVEKAMEIMNGSVLITTFTEENELSIRQKFIEMYGYTPKHVTIQTWFSFLLQHGVRPYQNALFDKRINGMILVNGRSGIKRYFGKTPIYYGEEKEFEKHYFTKDYKIYSDKISKFVCRCNDKSENAVINRISKIYAHIFVDEVQDLAGYDLEILNLLFKCSSNILLVGDPRQGTYVTSNVAKNKKYQGAAIINFFRNVNNLEIDENSKMINYRCAQEICDLSDSLYPEFTRSTSGKTDVDSHQGVFFIRTKDVDKYLDKYLPMQLRYDKTTKVSGRYQAKNYGESKGLSFNRVLLYPTRPTLEWLKDSSHNLPDTSRAKFYVALTRARHSVAIVNDHEIDCGIEFYDP